MARKTLHKLPSFNENWPQLAMHGDYFYVHLPPLADGPAPSDALVRAGLPVDIFKAEPWCIDRTEGFLQPAIMAPCPLAELHQCAILLPEGEYRTLSGHLAAHHGGWWHAVVDARDTEVRGPRPTCGETVCAPSRVECAMAMHMAMHTAVPGKPYISCLFADCAWTASAFMSGAARSREAHIRKDHGCTTELCTDSDGHSWVYLIKPIVENPKL